MIRLDLMMPDVNGFDLVEALNERGRPLHGRSPPGLSHRPLAA
jgi:CheY-like chemotaxis protein